MDHADHVRLLRDGVGDVRGGTWADLGAGRGAFTLALADLLGPGARIVAVDRDADALREAARTVGARFPATRLETLVADLEHPLQLPRLDGLVAANSLHFIASERQVAAVRRLAASLRPAGRFLVVEYDTDHGNPWVPHPFSFETWSRLAVSAGLTTPIRIGRVPSRFLGAIYAAASERPAACANGTAVDDVRGFSSGAKVRLSDDPHARAMLTDTTAPTPTAPADDAAAVDPIAPTPIPGASNAWLFPEGALLQEGRHVLKRLGGGERFEAYVAWDDRLHAAIVAKVLRPHLLDDARAKRALQREADALMRLQHPDLVRSFGAVIDGPVPHLGLEFLDGPRLSTLVRRYGPLSPEQSILLARRLASVLAYLATEGWVHLDVKPRNVVVTATPRLIDLSIARPIEAARGRTGIGTDIYMAPEQADPARADLIGPPADVWGLGATVYEAVTGTPAFPRVAGGPKHPQLTSRPGRMPDRVPRPMAEVLMACLAERPSDRPTATEIDDLLEPLSDWASKSSRRLR